MDKVEKQTQIDKAFHPPPEGRGLYDSKALMKHLFVVLTFIFCQGCILK